MEAHDAYNAAAVNEKTFRYSNCAGLGFGRPKLGFGPTMSKTGFKPSFIVQNCPKLS